MPEVWPKTTFQRVSQATAAGSDIKALGMMFLISGCLDLVWIITYPDYALKVFGTSFSGWAGEALKYQHPVIHWTIGYGFWKTRRWAFGSYLFYLGIAGLSEVLNQVVLGYNHTRTTMILVSLLFGSYIVARRGIFSSPGMPATH